ncbi:MAG TPA: BamA/TamA family outer membrane protein, partial [Rhodothermales bacterium]
QAAVAQSDTEDYRPSRLDWLRPLYFETRLPWSETGLEYWLPPIRYNRTEGFVLGFEAPALTADDWQRAKPVGQVGYAFALGEWRVDAGVEARPLQDVPTFAGTRVGVRYRLNTVSEDTWKVPSTENTLAAFVFRNDFFDYYEAQGWSIYLSQPLGRRVQVSVGYSSEDHRALGNETSWSIFGDGPFRPNPLIDEGQVRSINAALEAGVVRHLYARPRGSAVRVEFETAPESFGGDLHYTRVTADARTYGRITRHTTYAARVRGAYTDEDAPIQKLFTLGGVGTVRGYPINWMTADRMVLANLEYGLSDVELILENLDLFGFADAAWTSFEGEAGRDEEILASVGLGVGFAERKVRLELAFPLQDAGFGMEPSLWFRLYPQF